MNNAIGIDGIVDKIYPKQGINYICNAGFKKLFIDIGIYVDEKIRGLLKEKDINNIDVKSTLLNNMLNTKSIVNSNSLNIVIMKAPQVLKSETYDNFYEINLKYAKASIEICTEFNCKLLIVSPLDMQNNREKEWEINKIFYIELSKIAKENNVLLLLQSKYFDLNGHLIRGVCSDPFEASRWIKNLNNVVGEQIFGYCLDVGICNIFGQDMYEFVKTIGKDLKAVISRENDGKTDEALIPFSNIGRGQSKTEWLGIVRGLREMFFDGLLILNIKDTAYATPTLLHSSMLINAKTIIDYFIWQIEIENSLKKYKKIVLFGAGNMCRNYMKCYGEKYHPLFTCDNNSDIWGTKFAGLDVKSPEELKNIPDDCAIFICNIYYVEIKKQLGDLGIKNPIEFFNDEYLPLFHFDRIDTTSR